MGHVHGDEDSAVGRAGWSTERNNARIGKHLALCEPHIVDPDLAAHDGHADIQAVVLDNQGAKGSMLDRDAWLARVELESPTVFVGEKSPMFPAEQNTTRPVRDLSGGGAVGWVTTDTPIQ